MHPIQELLPLIPEGSPKPNPRDIDSMRSIDAAVNGTREELLNRLAGIEDAARPYWKVGRARSWDLIEQPEQEHNLALMPQHTGNEYDDPDALNKVHRKRLDFLRVALGRHVRIEDGGLKSPYRAKAKMEHNLNQGKRPIVADCSRVRVICNDLADLEQIYHRLLSADLALLPLGVWNRYSRYRSSRNTAPLRSINTSWGDIYIDADDTESFATEVQLLTARVRAVMDLNHAFAVSKKAQYPSPEAEVFCDSILIKASILDFRDRFSRALPSKMFDSVSD